MNAIGEELRAARTAKGLNLEQVSEETNIARRYLAALEDEDFSVFPGDPYVIGFLRTYAEYLGLDPQAMLQSFRGLRIQEQPVPLEELLPSKKKPLWPFLVAALIIAGGVGAFLLARDAPSQQAEPELARGEPQSVAFDKSPLERRFFEGDELVVSYGGQRYALRLASIDDRVAIETPTGVLRFMLGEEGSIDLDKDNRPELSAFISDFQKGDASKGAVIAFKASDSLALTQGEQAAVAEPAAPGSEGSVAGAEAPTAAASGADRPDSKEFIVFSGKRSPHPFVLNVTFRNYAMFRHELDRKEREERYYHKGDQISATANNSAKLWTSNAAACKVTIQASGGQSVDLELGSPGEVAVKMLRWTQAEDSTWTLALYDVN